MSNTKHAPGPWHVAEWEVRDSDGAIEAGGWQVVGADGYAINTCISEGDGEQEEANLHFIVRACNEYYGMRQDLSDARTGWEQATEDVREAEEVLAKERALRERMVAALVAAKVAIETSVDQELPMIDALSQIDAALTAAEAA